MEIKNDAGVASFFLYGAISPWDGDIVSKDFAEAVEKLPVGTKQVNLYINSPGGDVFEAKAIRAVIKRIDCPVNAYIDGLCASAATTVAMACDKIYMSDGGHFMIHNVSCCTYGNKDELRAMADTMQGIEETIVSDYCNRTGIDVDEMRNMVNAETWFNAKEALEKGFIDEVIRDDKRIENKASEPITSENKTLVDDDVGYMTNINRLRLLSL